MNERLSDQLVGASRHLLPFFEDPEVTDILINGTTALFLERRGVLEAFPTPFQSVSELMILIERLLVHNGKRMDGAQPYMDGSLVDGSRYHMILPPLSIQGPCLSIRKLSSASSVSLDNFGDEKLVAWLQEEVLAKETILITGATGAGKTTLLRSLLEQVPVSERIVVLEETREIRANHPHMIHLESRQSSPEGKGEVTLRALLRNALRMRPDRIVLGECRGGEAFDLIQCLNTGHRGAFATLHANGALEGLRRLEGLTMLAGFELPIRVIREWISASVSRVIHVAKQENRREIVEVIKVHGMEGERYRFTPVFSHKSQQPKRLVSCKLL